MGNTRPRRVLNLPKVQYVFGAEMGAPAPLKTTHAQHLNVPEVQYIIGPKAEIYAGLRVNFGTGPA